MDNVPIEFVVDVLSLMFEGCIKKLKKADSEVWSGVAEEFHARMFPVSVAVFLPPDPATAYVICMKREKSGQLQLWHPQAWGIEYRFARIELLVVHGIKHSRERWKSEDLADVRLITTLTPTHNSKIVFKDLNELNPRELGWTMVRTVHPGFRHVKCQNLTRDHRELFLLYYRRIYNRAIVKKIEFFDFPFGTSTYSAPINTLRNNFLELVAFGQGAGITDAIVTGFDIFGRPGNHSPRTLLITTPFIDRKALIAMKVIHRRYGCPHQKCQLCQEGFDIKNCPLDSVTFAASI